MKRYAHRADGAPGSARSRFRRSEGLCGQGQDRTVDLPLMRSGQPRQALCRPAKRTSLMSGTALGGRCSIDASRTQYTPSNRQASAPTRTTATAVGVIMAATQSVRGGGP